MRLAVSYPYEAWERLMAALAAAQQPAGDGCHCATCTCNPGMTPAIRFDTSPAAQEGAVRDHLIALGWTPPGAQQPASVPVRVTWAEFWIAQGDWETANDYAAFEKAERWLLAQKPASVEERENEHG